jgi:hypothetical protein
MTTAGSMASFLPSSTRGLEADLATGEDLAQGLTSALQRTRPLWRFLLNVTSSGWGRAAEGGR